MQVDPPDPPDPPDPRLLSSKNPHPLDGRVEFHEEGHFYTHTQSGLDLPKSQSQTKVTGPFFDLFNADEVVDNGFNKWKCDRESSYWGLINYLELCQKKGPEEIKKAIKALWDALSARASLDGTRMHKEIETYLNGLLPPPTEADPAPMGVRMLQQMLESFYPDQKLVPWRVEFSVCVEVVVEKLVHMKMQPVPLPAVAGNIDAIFRSEKDGRYWILDWKRVNPQRKGLLGKHGNPLAKRKRMPDMATGQFAKWEASSFHMYSAQLLGYRWQLIKGGYIAEEDIAGCFLVQMFDGMPRAHVIEVADMQEEVDAVMTAAVEGAKAAYRKELEPSLEEVPDEFAWSIKF
jgi:hypothetical protein